MNDIIGLPNYFPKLILYAIELSLHDYTISEESSSVLLTEGKSRSKTNEGKDKAVAQKKKNRCTFCTLAIYSDIFTAFFASNPNHFNLKTQFLHDMVNCNVSKMLQFSENFQISLLV